MSSRRGCAVRMTLTLVDDMADEKPERELILDMRVQVPGDEKIVCIFVLGDKIYVATERKVYSVKLNNG